MKTILRYPFRLLNGLLDRSFALAGALLLAQFPQFYSQYLQRLGGHLEEMRRTVAAYEEAAAAAGLSLERYVEEHLISDSEVFTSSGQIIASLVERLAKLEQSCEALLQASPFSRWLVFLSEADWAITSETWRSFTPGVPTTLEGAAYAAAGLLLGWGAYVLLRTGAKPLFRRFTKKNQEI